MMCVIDGNALASFSLRLALSLSQRALVAWIAVRAWIWILDLLGSLQIGLLCALGIGSASMIWHLYQPINSYVEVPLILVYGNQITLVSRNWHSRATSHHHHPLCPASTEPLTNHQAKLPQHLYRTTWQHLLAYIYYKLPQKPTQYLNINNHAKERQ